MYFLFSPHFRLTKSACSSTRRLKKTHCSRRSLNRLKLIKPFKRLHSRPYSRLRLRRLCPKLPHSLLYPKRRRLFPRRFCRLAQLSVLWTSHWSELVSLLQPSHPTRWCNRPRLLRHKPCRHSPKLDQSQDLTLLKTTESLMNTSYQYVWLTAWSEISSYLRLRSYVAEYGAFKIGWAPAVSKSLRGALCVEWVRPWKVWFTIFIKKRLDLLVNQWLQIVVPERWPKVCIYGRGRWLWHMFVAEVTF